MPPVSLTDLPNELNIAILGALRDESLLAFTSVSSRFRLLSGIMYLERLGIVVSQGNHSSLYLCDRLPPQAVLLLCAIPLPPKVTFTCDLFFLIQFEEELCRLFSGSSMITGLTINIPDTETHLLRLARLPSVLGNFLASLSHTHSCKSIKVEVQTHSAVQPRFPTLPRKRTRKRFNGGDKIHTLMQTVKRLSLNTIIMESEELWKVGRLLLAGPVLFDLGLHFHSRSSVSKILSEISFPSLTMLHVRSPFPIATCLPLLRHHRNLCSISFSTVDMISTTYPRRHPLKRKTEKSTSIVALPYLTHLQFSPAYCSWLSVFDSNSFPNSLSLIPTKWCPELGCRDFCEVLNGLCFSLQSLAIRELTMARLKISFPHRLATHIRKFHRDGAPCAIPDIQMTGVKDLTLDFFYGLESIPLVCSSDFLAFSS